MSRTVPSCNRHIFATYQTLLVLLFPRAGRNAIATLLAYGVDEVVQRLDVSSAEIFDETGAYWITMFVVLCVCDQLGPALGRVDMVDIGTLDKLSIAPERSHSAGVAHIRRNNHSLTFNAISFLPSLSMAGVHRARSGDAQQHEYARKKQGTSSHDGNRQMETQELLRTVADGNREQLDEKSEKCGAIYNRSKSVVSAVSITPFPSGGAFRR
ncbi:hypothetical protein BWQ96_03791 [Gracilariopsis chorda]|uniref:Uncharacterized protein n=1 Tax=Gracilariopsis chorda TaxID=448386 RepID=A0A2V3IWE7_9FLOR|nr:hypothetical protein BWQ96_03791 [Gracilariopsis chorda]|eukprot:PXF46466.1 hypothetical protein BWQ96_03791 [Gracilariopsis chorda]